ncbi:MAG: sigma-54-dependent Fis family transcriptional regulator [Limnobacter sp.]|nr:sigma-54-dependent Fis family transcriptional regulator [Limnobacter sp.]
MPALPGLASYLEALPQPHIVFDRDYRILAANAAYLRLFSPSGTALGRRCHEVSHGFDAPCDRSGESCPMALALRTGQRERVLHLHHTPRGDEYVDIELTPLADDRGAITHFVERIEPVALARAVLGSDGLVGRSAAFRDMLALVARVAPSDAAVLLYGESGTGKELVAQALHAASARAARPLVPVECASLSESLFESELFGHERGAFTGATTARTGLVEAADGGTLFLDEVGDIPPGMQVKLLRLLETGTFRRVGSTELRRADLRIVSATHRALPRMVEQGRFRQDLFYRLAVFPIRLPPLRERIDDLPLLVDTLLRRVAPRRRFGVSAGALERLAGHPFPGNVRELRNLLERASLLCDGEIIEKGHIEGALDATPMSIGLDEGADSTPVDALRSRLPAAPVPSAAVSRGAALRKLELQALRERLAAHRGSRAELAKSLGISERSLYRKLRELKSADDAEPDRFEDAWTDA